jgi:hypothetical protein
MAERLSKPIANHTGIPFQFNYFGEDWTMTNLPMPCRCRQQGSYERGSVEIGVGIDADCGEERVILSLGSGLID